MDCPQYRECRACLRPRLRHALPMFVISEAEAAAIRAIFPQRGEFSAAIELRRLFPGITDNAQAQAHSVGCRDACRSM